MVEYLHFRILKFPLISSRGCVAKVLHIGQGMSAGRDANHLVSCGIASGSPYESNESYTTLIWYIPSYKYIHIQYIYNTYTIHIQYIYNTYTIHIQYNTYTIHIQYIYNTYTIHIYIYILNLWAGDAYASSGYDWVEPWSSYVISPVAPSWRKCQWQSMSQWPTHIMWILQWLTDLPSMTIKTGSHIQHLLCWFWIFRFKHF